MKYLIPLILFFAGCSTPTSLKDMSHNIDHAWDRTQINNLKDDVSVLQEKIKIHEQEIEALRK